MTSDKDEILTQALQELLDVYIEGVVFNKDVYGYWSLLENEVFNVSLLSFYQGLVQYQRTLKESSSPDLMSYDLKLRVRLLNNEFILAATNEVTNTFQERMLETIDAELFFDFTIEELNPFERVLFLFFIYIDKIRLAALSGVNNLPVKKKRG